MSKTRGELILAIETSNPSAVEVGSGSVALGRKAGEDVEELAERAVSSQRRHDDALMPAIAELFEEAGATARQIGRVAVSIGPGGFTGLRVSVTTAKMIAEATGAEVVGVPTALVAAAGRDGEGAFAVALASKAESAWVAVFDGEGRVVEAGRLMDAGDLAGVAERFGVATLVADGHLAAPMRTWAEEAGVRIEAPRLSGAACLRASVGMASVDAGDLAPLYPREPEAVTKWRELHGPGGRRR